MNEREPPAENVHIWRLEGHILLCHLKDSLRFSIS